MSLVDAFAKEDRTEVKFSQFFALVKQAAQYETVMNAVNCDVPHRFIRETMTGKKEEVPEIPEKKEAVLGVVKVDFDAEELKDGAYCLGENNLLRAHLLNVAVDININDSRMKPVKLEKRAHIDGAVSIFDALAVKMKFHKEIGRQLTNAA